MTSLIIAGTDTGVGKTVVSAMLMRALDGTYWKPIQSGVADGTDRARVMALTGMPPERFIPEAYVLREPLSPHRAAELDGIAIDVGNLGLPKLSAKRMLIVETAGGVMVPIDRSFLQIALLARWQAPVVLVARTALGTINHTLLSLEALRNRNIAVLGVVFVGETMPDTERTIGEIGAVKILGRVPFLPVLDAVSLAHAFHATFRARDFGVGHGP